MYAGGENGGIALGLRNFFENIRHRLKRKVLPAGKRNWRYGFGLLKLKRWISVIIQKTLMLKAHMKGLPK